MKECKVRLLGGIINCSQLGENRCAFMANDGIPEGDLTKLPDHLADTKQVTYVKLLLLEKEYGEGGYSASMCFVHRRIHIGVRKELTSRKKRPKT